MPRRQRQHAACQRIAYKRRPGHARVRPDAGATTNRPGGQAVGAARAANARRTQASSGRSAVRAAPRTRDTASGGSSARGRSPRPTASTRARGPTTSSPSRRARSRASALRAAGGHGAMASAVRRTYTRPCLRAAVAALGGREGDAWRVRFGTSMASILAIARSPTETRPPRRWPTGSAAPSGGRTARSFRLGCGSCQTAATRVRQSSSARSTPLSGMAPARSSSSGKV